MVNERDDRDVLAARIFGEIQAEGLRAAGALVERLVHLVDGPHVTTADDPETAQTAGPDMGAVVPWLELWRELLERTSDTVERIRGATAGPAGEGVRVDLDGSLAPTHPLVVGVDAGGRGQADMWLHNGTDDDHGELVPQLGPLSDGYGNVLACQVDVNPPKIDHLHSRSSRGFVISVATEPLAVPATYRGVVQVRGAESVWMPIEVVVNPS